MSQDERETVVTSASQVGKKQGKQEACLVVIYGLNLGKRYNLKRARQVIGRSENAHIQIDQESISRQHARIERVGKSYILVDMESTNGTYLNDELIHSSRELRDGDYIKVGRTIFKYLSGTNIEAEYHEEIYLLTTTDGLTRTHNKRYLLETLNREVNRCERYQRYLSLCLFDLDHFKQVNDTYGHLAGDDVLRQMADLVRTNIRREDVFARYGGEEFAVVLPEVDTEGAFIFAEKIRQLIEEHTFHFEDDAICVTASLGITSIYGKRISHKDLIKQADDALYEAKNSGRNQVIIYQGPELP